LLVYGMYKQRRPGARRAPSWGFGRFACWLWVSDAEEGGHFGVEKALAGTVRLDPFAVEDELRDGLLANVFKDFISGTGDLLDVDLGVGNVVLGEEALGFTAVTAPRGGVNGQLHASSLRETRNRILW
jgi:hypothetical protein